MNNLLFETLIVFWLVINFNDDKSIQNKDAPYYMTHPEIRHETSKNIFLDILILILV